MLAYARASARAYEESGVEAPGHEIPLPGLAEAESQVAVPAIVLGQLVGVLVIESPQRVAFTTDDEALLTIVATMVASAIEIDWAQERDGVARDCPPAAGTASSAPADAGDGDPRALLRGRRQHLPRRRLPDQGRRRSHPVGAAHAARARDGRVDFTNKEVRLDPTLELPEFRDNLESRLILLEAAPRRARAPIRIEKTGRGRFRLAVESALTLECIDRDDV